MVKRFQTKLGEEDLTIEIGKLAKQAAGAVMVCYGESVVFASVVSADPPVVISLAYSARWTVTEIRTIATRSTERAPSCRQW